MFRSATAAFVFGVMLCGCAVGPDYHRPDPQVPATFAAQATPTAIPPVATGPSAGGAAAGARETAAGTSGAAAGALGTAAGTSSTAGAPGAPAADYATWWRSFHDPKLESLIDRAVKANPDVLMALDHLQAARTGWH